MSDKAKPYTLADVIPFQFCGKTEYSLAGDGPISHRVRATVEALEKAEAERAKLQEAVGLMTTAKPDMVMRADDPVGMAREVVEHVGRLEAERDEARADAARLRESLEEVMAIASGLDEFNDGAEGTHVHALARAALSGTSEEVLNGKA